MNRHQILTGACNGGDCYALGSVEGVNFVVSKRGWILSESLILFLFS